MLEPHEHTIPEDRMSDYRELKNMGMMQMSQIYNLMFGGRVMATGVLGKHQYREIHALTLCHEKRSGQVAATTARSGVCTLDTFCCFGPRIASQCA